MAQPSRGLRSKRTQEAQLFTDDHPYFPDKCGACPFNKTSPLTFHNKGKDCYSCKSVSDATQAAKIKRREQMKRAAQEVQQQIINMFGLNATIHIPTGKNGGTGELRVTTKGLRNYLKGGSHSRTAESKQMLIIALSHPELLRHTGHLKVGATKDMNNEGDKANVMRKQARGVVAYNYYELIWSGKKWGFGFEELKYGYEQPYYIQIKK